MGHRYPPNGGVEWPGMWAALMVLFPAHLSGLAAVAFFDIFKGDIAVLIAWALGLVDWLLGGAAPMAVLGHNRSL